MSDCIIHPNKPSKGGYINLGTKGNYVQAHRKAWIDAHDGQVPPKGMEVCHTCDVKTCVNPDHLFLGTHQDNADDMVAKGRSAKGIRCGNAKLTDDEVLLIRARYNAGGVTQHALADEFGVGTSQICRIILLQSRSIK